MKVKDLISQCDLEDEIFVALKPKDEDEIPSLRNVIEVDRIEASFDEGGTMFGPFVILLYSEDEEEIVEFDELDSLVEPEKQRP